MRTELARRAQSRSEDMKEKMLEASDTIDMEKQNKLEISAGDLPFLLFSLHFNLMFQLFHCRSLTIIELKFFILPHVMLLLYAQV